jgi:hypothetical protein
VEDDVDVLYIEIELEMTFKRLEVSGMTWLLVEDNVDDLHVEIELVMTFKRLEVSCMT